MQEPAGGPRAMRDAPRLQLHEIHVAPGLQARSKIDAPSPTRRAADGAFAVVAGRARTTKAGVQGNT